MAKILAQSKVGMSIVMAITAIRAAMVIMAKRAHIMEAVSERLNPAKRVKVISRKLLLIGTRKSYGAAMGVAVSVLT